MARVRRWLACLTAAIMLFSAVPAAFADGPSVPSPQETAAQDQAQTPTQTPPTQTTQTPANGEAIGDATTDAATGATDGSTVDATVDSIAEATADASAAYIRIKNKWQSNYLYEASDGVVRYGLTASEDTSSHWTIEDGPDGTKRIQNRKTGHYVTLEGVSKRRDPLTAKAAAESAPADRWYIEPASRAGYNLIKSATVPSSANLVIHEEDQLGFAEASNDINVTFESPQWAFEPVAELQPVRIVNRERAGQALYVKANPEAPDRPNDTVAFGKVDPGDAKAQWYAEPGEGGGVKLRNRATGQYIVQFDPDNYWRKIETGTSDDPLKLEWTVADAKDEQGASVPGYVTFSSAFNASYVLNTQFPDDTFARSNDWSNAGRANAHWKLEPVSDIKPVRIVNFTTGSVGTDYLYEDGGVVKHGALGTDQKDDPRYQWIVEDYDGAKRIRNAATGHYVAAGDPLLTTGGAGEGSAEDQWFFQASSQYDDYVTIRGRADGAGYLNIAEDGDTARSGDVDPNSDGAQWLLEDPSVPTDGTPQYVRIQNEWQPFVLYEDAAGELKYGNARSDQRDQWAIEKFNGRKRIQNRATGHYINLQSMKDGHIQVSDVEDSWTSAVWIIETLGGGSKLIRSVNDPSSGGEVERLINLQNLTKYAEYAAINRNWGSPKWKFLTVAEDRPSNVRLVNKKTGQVLYEEVSASDPTQGIVRYGEKPASDPSAVWFLEDAATAPSGSRTGRPATTSRWRTSAATWSRRIPRSRCRRFRRSTRCGAARSGSWTARRRPATSPFAARGPRTISGRRTKAEESG